MTNSDPRPDAERQESGPVREAGQETGPIERLEKFALEWGVLIAGGRYGNLIYGLHTGDAREAELRHTDLCDVLALVAALKGQSE